MNIPHDRSTGRDGASSTGASPGDPNRPAQGASDVDDAAKDVAEQLKSEGKAQVDQYRDVAADKIDTLADSVKAAASKLEGDDVGHLSGHIADMANSMSQLSDGLRNKSADQIMHDVSRIARENPALFIAGSIAVGFGLTRFARASAQGNDASSEMGSGQSSSGSSSSQNRSSSSGTGADSAQSSIPGMVSHPATSGGSGSNTGTRASNTANTQAGAAGSTASDSGTGSSYSSSINDASLGTGAGSSMATGRSRDPSGRDAGGGSTAAGGALDPSSAPYNTAPEQSNGRKPS